MKVFMNIIKILSLVLIIFWNTNHICAQDNNKTSRILWQRQFGCGENFSCSSGAIAFDQVNNNLLIMGTSFHTENYTGGKFWLWEIDKQGNRIINTVLKSAPGDLSGLIELASDIIKGLTVSKNEDIFAVGEFDGPYLSFMKMDRKGKIVFSKRIVEESLIDEREIDVLKMISLPDNKFLLIGREDDDGLVIKIDSEGNILWKKTYDSGQEIDFFSDGVPVGNGGDFLITGNAADSGGSAFLTKLSNVWVLQFDAKGNIVTEKFFSGGSFPTKLPQLCQLDSENFVVTYDKSTEMITTDHRIKAFSPNLKILWEKQIVKSEKAPPIYFKIMGIPEGGFIVADFINFSDLKVYEYDNEGNKLSSVSINNINFISDFNLAYTEDKLFIVSGSPSKRNDTITEVKVIALELNKLKR